MRGERFAAHIRLRHASVVLVWLYFVLFAVTCNGQTSSDTSGQELTAPDGVVIVYEVPVTLNITSQSHTSLSFTVHFTRPVRNLDFTGSRFLLVGCVFQGPLTTVSEGLIFAGTVIITDNVVSVQLDRFAATDANGNLNQASNTLSVSFTTGHNAGDGLVVNGDLVPWGGTACLMAGDRVLQNGVE
eukprot:6342898-Pyramimonas_sp.AAC.1